MPYPPHASVGLMTSLRRTQDTTSMEPIRNCHITEAVPLQDTSTEEVQSFNYLQENLSLPIPARLFIIVKVWVGCSNVDRTGDTVLKEISQAQRDK